MSSSASSSSTPTLAAGPSNGAHPLLTNNDEKNRYLLRPVAAHRVLTYYHSVVIKVGMVGDSQIGKTSLMVKYVEGSFDEDYIQTLGTSLLRA
jgi:GTP-binding protein of the ras superfamily involved in termination of M-phase